MCLTHYRYTVVVPIILQCNIDDTSIMYIACIYYHAQMDVEEYHEIHDIVAVYINVEEITMM